MQTNGNSPVARITGVLAPVVTPFSDDGNPDKEQFLRHCQAIMKSDVHLAIFGTNSEANSLSVEERIALTEHLLESGIDAKRLLPGTGCCALPDTVKLTSHAIRAGARGVMVLPPFYYKGVTDDGLFAYFSEFVEAVADERLRIYLYHFPAMSGVPISLKLIERLLQRYPSAFAGMKDSTGQWESTRSYIDAFGSTGFDVFPGTELLLLRAMHAGAAGCISATANVNHARIQALYNNWNTDQAPVLDADVAKIRTIFQAYPMISAMKWVLAKRYEHASWKTVRAPLTSLSSTDADSLYKQLQEAGYDCAQ